MANTPLFETQMTLWGWNPPRVTSGGRRGPFASDVCYAGLATDLHSMGLAVSDMNPTSPGRDGSRGFFAAAARKPAIL